MRSRLPSGCYANGHRENVLHGALTHTQTVTLQHGRPSAFPFVVPCWAVFVLPSRIPFAISSALFLLGNSFYSFLSFIPLSSSYLQVVQVLGRSHQRRSGRRRWAGIAADRLELSGGGTAAVEDSLGHSRRVFAPLARVDGGSRRSDDQSGSHCRFRFRPLGGVLDVADRPQRRVRSGAVREEHRR